MSMLLFAALSIESIEHLESSCQLVVWSDLRGSTSQQQQTLGISPLHHASSRPTLHIPCTHLIILLSDPT